MKHLGSQPYPLPRRRKVAHVFFLFPGLAKPLRTAQRKDLFSPVGRFAPPTRFGALAGNRNFTKTIDYHIQFLVDSRHPRSFHFFRFMFITCQLTPYLPCHAYHALSRCFVARFKGVVKQKKDTTEQDTGFLGPRIYR